MQAVNGKEDGNYKKGPVCSSGQSILYAWALDAPKLALPKGKLINKKKFFFNLTQIIILKRCCFQSWW